MKKIAVIFTAVFMITAIYMGSYRDVRSYETEAVRTVTADQESEAPIADDTEEYIFKATKEADIDTSSGEIRSIGHGMYVAKNKDVLDEMVAPEDIEYAEEDITMELTGYSPTPNDPSYPKQNNLKAMKVPYAWEKGLYGSEDVTIAVIDSGLTKNHDDLDYSHILKPRGYVGKSKAQRNNTSDTLGHGSLVAGIIMAKQNNNKAIAGICPNIKLLPMKVFDKSVHGSSSDVIEAMYDAVDAGVDVINMSMTSDATSRSLKDACDYATKKGCIIVAAAGNDGKTKKQYPAAYDNVIAVGSVNRNGLISYFSQRGSWVYVTAPGENVYGLSYTGSGYQSGDGTSFAAPEVAALACIAKSVNSKITTAGFKKLLRQSSDNTTAGRNSIYGYGRVNFEKATKLLLGITIPLNKSNVEIEYTRTPYTGKVKIPDVIVSDGSNILRKGYDYTVSITDNKEVGKAKVEVKGIGLYSGSVTVEFEIYDPVIKAEAVKQYDGSYSLSQDAMDSILEKLETGSRVEISAEELNVKIPHSFLDSISGYPLTVKSDSGYMELDKSAMKALAATGRDVMLRIDEDGNISVTDDDAWMEKGIVKAGLKIPSDLIGIRKYVEDENGNTYIGTVKNELYVFTLKRSGRYIVKDRDQAAKEITRKLVPAVSVKRTGSYNILTVKCNVRSLEKFNYKVKYSFYRSNKKMSGYKYVGTTSTKTYKADKSKKGYYKCRIRVYSGSTNVVSGKLDNCKPIYVK